MSQAVAVSNLGSWGFLRRRKLVRKPERSQGSAEFRDSVCVVAVTPGAHAAPTEEAAAQGETMHSWCWSGGT